MNRNYYIKEIRDLSKNYDSETQSKILDDLTDKFFDVKGIKELYETIKLYDILRDMDFELTDTQVEVFERLQDAEVNGGFF